MKEPCHGDPQTTDVSEHSDGTYTDIEIDLSDFDITAPLPTRQIAATELHAYHIAIAFVAMLALLLAAGIFRVTDSGLIEYVKTIGQTFGNGLSIVLCYYFVMASRHAGGRKMS